MDTFPWIIASAEEGVWHSYFWKGGKSHVIKASKLHRCSRGVRELSSLHVAGAGNGKVF